MRCEEKPEYRITSRKIKRTQNVIHNNVFMYFVLYCKLQLLTIGLHYLMQLEDRFLSSVEMKYILLT